MPLMVALVSSLMVLSCMGAAAAPLELRNLGVSADTRGLHLGFDVDVVDAAPLWDLLKRGEAVEVRVDATASRRRLGLWNQEVGNAQYRARVQADPVRQECVVTEANQTHAFACAELGRALLRLWRHRDLLLGPFDPSLRQQQYVVQVDFRVVRSDMPVWLTVPLFFLDWDLVPRTRYDVTFDY